MQKTHKCLFILCEDQTTVLDIDSNFVGLSLGAILVFLKIFSSVKV